MPQLIRPLEEVIAPGKHAGAEPGALDGITLMRYAHIYRERTSGGVEQYLRHLDCGLLKRHRMTILQMHLVRDGVNREVEVENVGIGRIVWVPVAIQQSESRLADLPGRIRRICRTLGANGRAGRRSTAVSTMKGLLRHRGGHLRYKAAILSDQLLDVLAKQRVDLLALHWLSYDAAALIAQAADTGVPFVFFNHFDNVRLATPAMRKIIDRAAAVGVISDLGLPDDLRARCINVSDAVDTDFFTFEKAQPVNTLRGPLLLLPARIETGKGHHDLLKAARILIAAKPDLAVAFVGAVDSELLHQELRASATEMGLKERVLFLGEKSAEQMRDWYAASSVVVLPTYAEGLGRVLLEAQAMKKPVVAYDTGGVGEAMLPNVTGYLARKGNAEELADKIRLLLEDDAERVRTGERGREFVSRRFSVSALIQRHEAFYLSALSRTSLPGGVVRQ